MALEDARSWGSTCLYSPIVLLSMTLWGCLGNILFPETKGLGGPCSSHTLQTHDRSSQAEKQPGRVWLINWWGSSCSWLHGSNSFSSTELGSAFLNILVLWGMTQPVSHPIRMGAFNVFSASVFTESPVVCPQAPVIPGVHTLQCRTTESQCSSPATQNMHDSGCNLRRAYLLKS